MPKKISSDVIGDTSHGKPVKVRKAKQEAASSTRQPTRKATALADPASTEMLTGGFDVMTQLLDIEAMAANRELQPADQKLPSIRSNLQSLAFELSTLNGQVSEPFDQQQISSDDLRNVFYSMETATLVLDQELRIRFFTPETKAIFSLLPGDIGRPLIDLQSLADDDGLLSDAASVLEDGTTIGREIKGVDQSWFQRRIVVCRTQDDDVCGVVITYVDVTEQRVAADLIEEAKQAAAKANRSKSRFLAVASQGLRQPLQALTLIQDMLTQTVKDQNAHELIDRSGLLLDAMGGIVNLLLDINQIEAGLMEANTSSFDAAELIDRLRAEFEPLAQSRGIDLRALPSRLVLKSDPRLLEVMMRNLLTNALSNTKRGGRILVVCRRRGKFVRIEVRDTGIGIEEDQLGLIFDEFYQIENSGELEARSQGLGLTIVRELGELLDHEVQVQSTLGRGSVFSVMVPQGSFNNAQKQDDAPSAMVATSTGSTIALVEDDPHVRSILEGLLTSAGHTLICANDGPAALEMVSAEAIRPDLVLTEYNLPGGMNGIELLAKIRKDLEHDVPCIVLTRDSSVGALAAVKVADCLLLKKPVVADDLHAAIAELAPRGGGSRGSKAAQPSRLVCVINDKPEIRETLRSVLEYEDWPVTVYPDAEAFLEGEDSLADQCLIIDTDLPGMSGIELIEHLRSIGKNVPAILITATGDIAMAVMAIRSGASDLIERPVGRQDLVDSIERAVSQTALSVTRLDEDKPVAGRLRALTVRQQAVLDLVMTGEPSKNIAVDLGISQRTVETHRANIMQKLGVRTMPDLVRTVMLQSVD